MISPHKGYMKWEIGKAVEGGEREWTAGEIESTDRRLPVRDAIVVCCKKPCISPRSGKAEAWQRVAVRLFQPDNLVRAIMQQAARPLFLPCLLFRRGC